MPYGRMAIGWSVLDHLQLPYGGHRERSMARPLPASLFRFLMAEYRSLVGTGSDVDAFEWEGTFLKWTDSCISQYVEYNSSSGLRVIVEAVTGLSDMGVKIGDRTIIFRRLVYEDRGREFSTVRRESYTHFAATTALYPCTTGRTSHRQECSRCPCWS